MAKPETVPPHGVDLAEYAAGVPSVRQSLAQEPSFPRKKRVVGSEGQISSEGVLRQDEEERNEANKALSFRAGYRRPEPPPVPSEYQVQFTWKSGHQPESPLLQAAERLRRNEGAGREGGGGEKKRKKSRNPQVNGHPPPHDKVEQLNSIGVDIDERQLKKGVSSSKSPGPVGERKSGRPVNRNQRSHGRQLRTRKVFETEYRTQFKAWPLPSSQVLPGTRGKKVRSPRKRSDVTDPRLITPSPVPAPLLPGPLRIWETEYSTHFKSPLDFKYIRGAWMETPHPTPTSKIGREPSPVHPLSGSRANRKTHEPEVENESGDEEEEEEGNGEGERGADECPILPQESLLAQLNEIRHKAVEYRQRSEGCHFLPTHSSWRLPADSERTTTPIRAHPSDSSSLSSPSVEEPVEENGMKPPRYSVPHPRTNGRPHLIEDEEEREGEEDEEEGEGESSESEEDEDSRPARSTPNTAKSPELKSRRVLATTSGKKFPTLSSSAPPNGEIEGRIPTPVLQQSSEGVLRHHLDRTTPSSGAVLTSPTLPAFVKTSSRDKTGTSRMGDRDVGKESRSNGGVGAAPVATRSSGHGGKTAASEARKKGLHLSQVGAKLKRDPSLLSSAPTRSTSHPHTLPKSSLAQHSREAPPAMPHPPGTRRAHHTLPTSPPHPSPPHSTISSLLSSIRTSSSSNPPNKKLNYTNASVRRKFAESSIRPTNPQCRSSHTRSTSGQCDICRAWLRKTLPHTGVQVENSSWNRQQPRVVPLGSLGSHKYRGPVTQLSEKLETRGVSSCLGVPHPSSVGSDSIFPQPNGVPFSNSPQGPPRVRATVPPQTNPRPLKEADELSISSLSLSSCSVASDLLRKARERREKFWTQPPPNTTHT